jgi:hypothetical protein
MSFVEAAAGDEERTLAPHGHAELLRVEGEHVRGLPAGPVAWPQQVVSSLQRVLAVVQRTPISQDIKIDHKPCGERRETDCGRTPP